MDYPQIAIIRRFRLMLVELTDSLTLEQLNKVPDGFRNNIIWNIGHLLVTLPGIAYRPAGLPVIVDSLLWHSYKPESTPSQDIDAETIRKIKELFLSTLDQFEQDLKDNKFTAYTPWVTRLGTPINNFGDAMALITNHEGLHTGYIMALRKLV